MDEFEKYRLLIMNNFDRQEADIKELKSLVALLHADLIEIKTSLKVSRSIFGFVTAVIGASVTLFVDWLIGRMK